MLYTSKDVTKLLGIGKNQLSYLVKTRIITPHEKVRGRGRVHKFSLENLFQLAVIKELVNFGIELSFIEEIVRSEQFCDSYKEGSLIIIRSENEQEAKIFLNTRKIRKIFLVINTRKIRQEIEEKTGERF